MIDDSYDNINFRLFEIFTDKNALSQLEENPLPKDWRKEKFSIPHFPYWQLMFLIRKTCKRAYNNYIGHMQIFLNDILPAKISSAVHPSHESADFKIQIPAQASEVSDWQKCSFLFEKFQFSTIPLPRRCQLKGELGVATIKWKYVDCIINTGTMKMLIDHYSETSLINAYSFESCNFAEGVKKLCEILKLEDDSC